MTHPQQQLIALALERAEIAKAFLHESGTDPEAWLDEAIDALRAALSAGAVPQQEPQKVGEMMGLSENIIVVPQEPRMELGTLLDLLDEAAQLLDDGAAASTHTLRAIYRDAVWDAVARLRAAEIIKENATCPPAGKTR